VDSYRVGAFIDSHEPRHIAGRIEEVFRDEERLKVWGRNSGRVRDELNWEREGQVVLEIFEQVTRENS